MTGVQTCALPISLGDIGKHFPDTDPQYKGISSLRLLEQVGNLLEEANYVVENIDATIIAQRPKMAPHIGAMRENIAQALGILTDQVNVKATTEEGLGFTGTGEGISAQAICALTSLQEYVYAWENEENREKACKNCLGCQKSGK